MGWHSVLIATALDSLKSQPADVVQSAGAFGLIKKEAEKDTKISASRILSKMLQLED
jgi:hypothetical protein